EGRLDVGAVDRPIDRGAQIVVVELQSVEPAAAAGTSQLGGAALREGKERCRVAAVDRVGILGRDESFHRVLANRGEHREAGLRLASGNRSGQALLDERPETIENVLVELTRRTADLLGLTQASPGGEHREPREQRPVRNLQEVVPPVDRAAYRLLPAGQVAGT